MSIIDPTGPNDKPESHETQATPEPTIEELLASTRGTPPLNPDPPRQRPAGPAPPQVRLPDLWPWMITKTIQDEDGELQVVPINPRTGETVDRNDPRFYYSYPVAQDHLQSGR